MPYITKYYSLGAFKKGDIYSPVIDKARFQTLDSNIAFAASLMGNGVIAGWSLTDVSDDDPKIQASAGMGIVDYVITRTSGNTTVRLEDNAINYVYMQKKFDYLGGYSGYSSIASIVNSDSTAPAPVSNLTVSATAYGSVLVSWDENVDPDFSYYLLERSSDEFATVEIISDSLTSPSHLDLTVEEDTVYKYRVKVVDLSGNDSSYITSAPVTSLTNLMPPSDVAFLLTFRGNGFVQLAWRHQMISQVGSYQITVEQLDEAQHLPTGVPFVYEVSSSAKTYVIQSLENNLLYRFTIKAVSHNGVLSSGVAVLDYPQYNTGPKEADELVITHTESDISPDGISISTSWRLVTNAYLDDPERFIISVIENGSTVSDEITVEGQYAYTFETFPVAGVFQKVKARTDYIIKIVGETNGIRNNGIIGRTQTSNFQPPSSPSNLSASKTSTGEVIFTWTNSVSFFDYNEISLDEIDNDTSSVASIYNDFNVGKTASCVVASSEIEWDKSYRLTVKAVDEFGNQSRASTFVFDNSPTGNRPTVPQNQQVSSGDGQVLITWDRLADNDSAFYRIWRANYDPALIEPSDFSIMDTVPEGVESYHDLSVEDGSSYYYFVTTINTNGMESLNPTDDDYCYYPLLTVTAYSIGDMSSPTSVTVVKDGWDAIITWDDDTDQFDGFEIYFSTANKHSWQKVGAVDRVETTFTHANALLKDGVTYNYTVRKFRDEGRLYATTSTTSPISSVFLAKVTVDDGDIVDIDTDASPITSKTENYMQRLSQTVIDDHRHSYASAIDDKRIRLDSVIVSNWETDDNQIFFTTQPITGATSYLVELDGESPTIMYNVSPSEGKITFQQPIEVEAEDVVLHCIGLSETTAVLEKERVDALDANQVASGTISSKAMPELNHAGRVEEKLIPLSLPMKSTDGFTYFIHQNIESALTENIGTAVCFYDFINISVQSNLCLYELTLEQWSSLTEFEWFTLLVDCDEDNTLEIYLSATSKGVLLSLNKGKDWVATFEPEGVPFKFYYSANHSRYYLITSKAVYTTDNGFLWIKCHGLDSVRLLRDICEDSAGNLYLSSDLGIWKLPTAEVSSETYLWTRCGIISARSNSAFAIWFDDDQNEILVSVEDSVFRSSDAGETWVISLEYESQGFIYSFVSSGDYLFALGDSGVWRRKYKGGNVTDFDKVAALDAEARLMTIFDDSLVCSTSKGLLISNSNVYTAQDLSLSASTPCINIAAKPLIASALREIDGFLYIGAERRVFRGGRTSTIKSFYTESNTIPPTIFSDAVEVPVGVKYYTKDDSVVFDIRQNPEFRISVANQYTHYRASGGGWLAEAYNANISFLKNSLVVSTISGGSVTLSSISSAFDSVEFDTFTEINSNSSLANIAVTTFNSRLSRFKSLILGTASFNEGETYQDVISALSQSFYEAYCRYIGKIRYTPLTIFGGNPYVVLGNERLLLSVYEKMSADLELVEDVPAVSVSGSGVAVDIASGIVVFSAACDKYQDMAISVRPAQIKGIGTLTHTELEDALAYESYALPEKLSQLYHMNILKMGMFIEQQWDGSLESENLLPESTTVNLSTANDWYNITDSSIDFSAEAGNWRIGLSLSYPSVVAYTTLQSGRILVGGDNGLLSVGTSAYSLNSLLASVEDQEVRDISSIENKIYAVCRHNLYYSENLSEWTSYNTKGLSGELKFIFGLSTGKLAVTSNGAYLYSEVNGQWESVLQLENIVFASMPDYLFLITSDGTIYYSQDGASFEEGGSIGNLTINTLVKYRGNLLAATDQGLRLISSSIYTGSFSSTLVNVRNNLEESAMLQINDIAVNDDEDELVLACSTGSYYHLIDNYFVERTDSGMESVHKVVFVADDFWLFGYDLFKPSNVAFPMKLSTGAPF